MRPFLPRRAALRVLGLVAPSALSLLILNPTAHAQTAGGDLELEEVVVTAQRREENLQKAALSITALEGEDLRERGRSSILDIVRGVPGVEIGGNGYMNIRGVGQSPSLAAGQDPSVTLNVNGVFMLNPQGGRDAYYDIARVEVARGPQTTLTGRTAEGGSINVITNEPNLKQLEMNGSLEAGNYSRKAATAVLNLPLGSSFALRVAGSHTQKEGYFYNTGGTGGAYNTNAARVRLLVQPNDDIKLVFSADYSHSVTRGQGGTSSVGNTGVIDLSKPFYTLNGYYWNPSPGDSRLYYTIKNYWGDFSWNTPAGVFTFAPNYQDNVSLSYPSYATNVPSLNTGLANGLSFSTALAQATTWTSSLTPGISRQYEFRWANPQDAKLKWMLGYYYYYNKLAFATLNGGTGTTSLPIAQYPVVYPQNQTRVSLDKDFFGQITIPFAATWRATFGARYSNDSKERGESPGGYLEPDGTVINTNQRFPINNNVAGSVAPNGPFIYYDLSAGSVAYKHTNWLAKLEHDFSATSMSYAMVSTGWKTGAFIVVPNLGVLCSTTPPPGAPLARGCATPVPIVTPGYRDRYDPEYLTSFEVGTKNTLLDGKLRLNGSLFYYDYDGYQFPYIVNHFNPATGVDPDFGPTFGQIGNAKAKSYGGEVETSWLFTQHDRVDLNVSYLHARLENVPVSDLAPQAVKTWAASLAGFTLPHSPTWQVRPKYEHIFNLRTGTFNVALDAQISTKQLATFLPNNCQQIPGTYAAGACTAGALTVGEYVRSYYTLPGFTKYNLSLGYHSSSGKWSVSGYVYNVTDKETFNTLQLPNSFVGTANLNITADDPRTYGVIVSVKL